jgi:hypothetical protein
MNHLVELNEKVIAIGAMDLPGPVKTIMRAPIVERMVKEITQIYFTAPMRSGSVDVNGQLQVSYTTTWKPRLKVKTVLVLKCMKRMSLPASLRAVPEVQL